MGSPDNDLSNTHSKYVACAFCFMFISLYLIFSLRIFLGLRLLAQSTNQSQIFIKFYLIKYFFNFSNIFMLVHKTWVIIIQKQIWFYCLRHIDINQKQKRSQDGTLRNSTRNYSKIREFVFSFYQKYSVTKVGPKPRNTLF